MFGDPPQMGLHGAPLIYGLFMRPRSAVIEFRPYEFEGELMFPRFLQQWLPLEFCTGTHHSQCVVPALLFVTASNERRVRLYVSRIPGHIRRKAVQVLSCIRLCSRSHAMTALQAKTVA